MPDCYYYPNPLHRVHEAIYLASNKTTTRLSPVMKKKKKKKKKKKPHSSVRLGGLQVNVFGQIGGPRFCQVFRGFDSQIRIWTKTRKKQNADLLNLLNLMGLSLLPEGHSNPGTRDHSQTPGDGNNFIPPA
ncbi:hypothetical protein CLAIMM_15144 [Cladophialophora immunda]|nr:hypothetical protein CLAIMM_15144 [Cladophialophora immunda]